MATGATHLAGAGNDPGGTQEHTATVPLFTQSGITVTVTGAATVIEQGQTLRASTARAQEGAGNIEQIPSTDGSAMRFVNAEYRLPKSKPLPVTVGISTDGVLVVEVPARVRGRMSRNRIMLLGMAIARTDLGVDPIRVTAVVIRLQ